MIPLAICGNQGPKLDGMDRVFYSPFMTTNLLLGCIALLIVSDKFRSLVRFLLTCCMEFVFYVGAMMFAPEWLWSHLDENQPVKTIPMNRKKIASQ